MLAWRQGSHSMKSPDGVAAGWANVGGARLSPSGVFVTDILSPSPTAQSSGVDDPGVDSSGPVSQAYSAILSVVEGVEPRIAGAIRSELTDQRGSLKLIASENYA